ncbi:MAG: glucodextranase DOMON-like domain-containing protein [Trueperaceae bacterium]
MNLAALLALLAITLTDPTGDAIGDGSLVPPTSTVYANVAMFDLQGVELEVAEDGAAVLRVTLGALGTTASSVGDESADGDVASAEENEAIRQGEAEQFEVSGLLAIVDVYLDTGAGGADQTLRGPNMLLPVGAGWHHAVRFSAEGAWGVTYAGTQADEGAPDGGAEAQAEPQTLTHVPLTTTRSGNVLSVVLPWQFDPEAQVDVYAMTGVHDPFTTSGWRALSESPSPFAFSGGEQVVPVVDLLAPDAETQAAALRSGVLPSPSRSAGMSLPLSPWLWLMVAGLALALLGLVLRGRVGAPVAADGAAPGSDESDEELAAEGEAEGVEDEGVDVLSTLLPFDGEPVEGEPDAGQAGEAELETELHGVQEAEPENADTDEVLLAEPPTEPDAPLEGPPPADPQPEAAAPTPPHRSPFSTGVEESYLNVGESGDEGDELGGGTELESFWHPGSRGRRTLVESSDRAAPDAATLGGASGSEGGAPKAQANGEPPPREPDA